MEKNISDISATVKHAPRYSEKTALRKPRWRSEETSLRNSSDVSADEIAKSKTKEDIRVTVSVK